MNTPIASSTFRYRPLWIICIAALLFGAVAAGVLFVTHPDRAQSSAAAVPGTVAGAAAQAPSSTAPNPGEELAVAPVASVSPFTCGASTLSAGGAPAVAPINALRTAAHPGYDRLVVQFSGRQPGSIEMRPQATSTFQGSPRGDAITLAGTRGLVVLVRGADMHTAYSGVRDLKTSYAGLRETRVIEDFEGQVTLGLGLKGSGCYRASVLSSPVRLVVDLQTS